MRKEKAALTRRVVAIPAAPARSKLKRAERDAVARPERGVWHREMLEEGTARLISPLRETAEP